jgi:nicotinamide-nucleotide amidase
LVEQLGPARAIIRSRTLRTVGLGESAIDARIGELMRSRNPTVGLAAHLGQVDVRVTARATDSQEADHLIAEVVEKLHQRLGNAIYGEGTEPLEAAVVRALRQSGQALVMIETNTLGEVAQRLRAVPGGAEALTAAYQLPGDLPLPPGGPAQLVSQAAADWLAGWLRQQSDLRLGASLVLTVCGVLDPDAGPYGTYRGETYITIAGEGWQEQQRIDVGGTDELARRWVGNAVLNRLRLQLLGS